MIQRFLSMFYHPSKIYAVGDMEEKVPLTPKNIKGSQFFPEIEKELDGEEVVEVIGDSEGEIKVDNEEEKVSENENGSSDASSTKEKRKEKTEEDEIRELGSLALQIDKEIIEELIEVFVYFVDSKKFKAKKKNCCDEDFKEEQKSVPNYSHGPIRNRRVTEKSIFKLFQKWKNVQIERPENIVIDNHTKFDFSRADIKSYFEKSFPQSRTTLNFPEFCTLFALPILEEKYFPKNQKIPDEENKSKKEMKKIEKYKTLLIDDMNNINFEIMDLFELIDQNGDGLLDLDEIQESFDLFNEPITRWEIWKLKKFFKKNPKGMNFENFAKFMLNKKI